MEVKLLVDGEEIGLNEFVVKIQMENRDEVRKYFTLTRRGKP